MSKIIFFSSLLMIISVSVRAQSIGAPYGTRDPKTCASTKEPARGPISSAKAKEYVTCAYEHERKNADELWLIDVQQVEVGKPRPFNIREDSSERIRVSRCTLFGANS